MPLAKKIVVLASLASVFAVVTPLLAADFTVQITTAGGFVFNPANLVIDVGDRVNWRNRASLQHTSTSGTGCSPNGLWDTGFINPNTTTAFVTFNTPGTYPYFCVPHCSFGMTGTIVVNQPPVATENRTWGAIKALYATRPQ
jgi:plastocyanin